jgi:hypothetical protein
VKIFFKDANFKTLNKTLKKQKILSFQCLKIDFSHSCSYFIAKLFDIFSRETSPNDLLKKFFFI